ncbi:unnamed protein product [Sympodiomycopsis kandeliae]
MNQSSTYQSLSQALSSGPSSSSSTNPLGKMAQPNTSSRHAPTVTSNKSTWKKIFNVRRPKTSSGASEVMIPKHDEIEYQVRPKFQRRTSDRHETCRVMRAVSNSNEAEKEAIAKEVKPECKSTSGTPGAKRLFKSPSFFNKNASIDNAKHSAFSSKITPQIHPEKATTARSTTAAAVSTTQTVSVQDYRHGPLAKPKAAKPRLPRGSLTVDKLCALDKALCDLASQRVKSYKSLPEEDESSALNVRRASASLQIIQSRNNKSTLAGDRKVSAGHDSTMLASLPTLSINALSHNKVNKANHDCDDAASASDEQNPFDSGDDDEDEGTEISSHATSSSSETRFIEPTLPPLDRLGQQDRHADEQDNGDHCTLLPTQSPLKKQSQRWQTTSSMPNLKALSTSVKSSTPYGLVAMHSRPNMTRNMTVPRSVSGPFVTSFSDAISDD